MNSRLFGVLLFGVIAFKVNDLPEFLSLVFIAPVRQQLYIVLRMLCHVGLPDQQLTQPARRRCKVSSNRPA